MSHALLLLLATVPMASALATPLAASPDGTEVLDVDAGLAWQRCVEGTGWNGKTCLGAARLMTHAEALAAAAQRRRETGQAWRVPRAPELQRLLRSRGEAERRVFPEAPAGWYWTATANVDTKTVNAYSYANVQRGITPDSASRMSFLHGWAVHTGTGEATGEAAKKARLPVRLVHTLQR